MDRRTDVSYCRDAWTHLKKICNGSPPRWRGKREIEHRERAKTKLMTERKGKMKSGDVHSSMPPGSHLDQCEFPPGKLRFFLLPFERGKKRKDWQLFNGDSLEPFETSTPLIRGKDSFICVGASLRHCLSVSHRTTIVPLPPSADNHSRTAAH